MGKTKKYIVTGGAGFIGSHLTDSLVKEGYEVVIIDNMSTGLASNLNPKASFEKIDIRDKMAVEELFLKEKPDGVFHLAAIVSVQFSLEHPEETFEVNVTGTKNVGEVARKVGAKMIFSSSSAVYGEPPDQRPITESSPLNPKNPYGEHKKAGEAWSDISLRYFNVYGGRQRGDSPYAGVIARFLALSKEHKPLTIFGDGSQTRDFVHVRDVVAANLKATKSILAKEAINIGSGKAVSIKRLADMFGGHVNYMPPRIEPKHSLADISKAKKFLGWSPRVTLEEGIKELRLQENAL
jgi:UDP-glucose 4-epimerase